MTSNQSEMDQAIEAALDATDPFESLRQVMIRFKDLGVSKDAAYATLDACRKCHENDPDDRKHDVVLDVMDLVYGWCSPGVAIYGN